MLAEQISSFKETPVQENETNHHLIPVIKEATDTCFTLVMYIYHFCLNLDKTNLFFIH